MSLKDESHKKNFVSSVSKVGLWTLGSRFLGLIRDSIVARYFGAGFATDAFMVAFRIPNLLRRLLAEGALSIAFVPTFSDIYHRQSKEDFQKAFQSLFSVFSTLLVAVSLLGMILSPWLVKLFAPGFENEKFLLTSQLTCLMFPFIFFVGSASVGVGLLNTLKSFSIPAASPIFLNLTIIFCAVTLTRWLDVPIFAVAIGVLLGGFIQWVAQFIKIQSLGYPVKFRFDFKHPAVVRVFRLMGPTVFGVAVYHLNILVIQAMATVLPQGSVTYLYYSDRFLEFPLGVFAISIATVALPQLAEDAAHSDYSKLKNTLFFSLRMVTFICVPAMLGMMALRVPMLSLVFQYGKFTLENTFVLSNVFLMASLGLWAVAGLRITVQVFYSLGDVKTPLRAAFISFLVNAVSGFLLMRVLNAPGLTLASSLAAWVQWGWLFVLLRKKIGPLGLRQFIRGTLPIVFSALLMAAALWPLGNYYISLELHSPLIRALFVGTAILFGAGIYLGFTYLFKVKEMRVFVEKYLPRIKKFSGQEPSNFE
jgi:putative peptidoglycan lipid II flippase